MVKVLSNGVVLRLLTTDSSESVKKNRCFLVNSVLFKHVSPDAKHTFY